MVRWHLDWAGYHLNATPATFHEAQVSVPYSVAVAAFTFGTTLTEQYSDELLATTGSAALDRTRAGGAVHCYPTRPRDVSDNAHYVNR